MRPAGAGSTCSCRWLPGEVVALSNVHLPAGPYSPNLVRRGAKRSTILEIERRVRVPAVEPSVTALTSLVDQGIPALLLGDFNTPSRLDWTPETVGLRDQIHYPVNWPTSRFVEDAGIRRLVPRGASRPRGGPGTDVAVREAATPGRVEPRAERPGRSDRLHLHGGRDRDARQRPGRRVGRPRRHDRGRSLGDRPPRDRVRALGGGRRAAHARRRSAPGSSSRGPTRRSRSTGRAGPNSTSSCSRRAIRRTRWPTSRCPARSTARWTSRPTAGIRDVRRAPPGGSHRPVADALLGRGGGRRTARVDVEHGSTGSVIRSRCAGGTHRATDGTGWACTNAAPIPNVASYLTWFYTRSTIQGRGTLDAASSGPWPLPPGRYSIYLLRGRRIRRPGSDGVRGPLIVAVCG